MEQQELAEDGAGDVSVIGARERVVELVSLRRRTQRSSPPREQRVGELLGVPEQLLAPLL